MQLFALHSFKKLSKFIKIINCVAAETRKAQTTADFAILTALTRRVCKLHLKAANVKEHNLAHALSNVSTSWFVTTAEACLNERVFFLPSTS